MLLVIVKSIDLVNSNFAQFYDLVFITFGMFVPVLLVLFGSVRVIVFNGK
jgi:hypothetical protein